MLTACGEEENASSPAQGAASQQPASGGGGQGGPGGGQQQAMPVGFMEVKPRQIDVTSELPGRVHAYRTAQIRPQVSGIIEERLFEEGSFVEKGQQLYQIDPSRYRAAYERAKANLQNARAELQNAQSLVNRYGRLIESNAISDQEYDDAKASLEQARAAVSLAEADVETAKINLDYTKVYSPITGYIGPSMVTEGALVTEQQQEALATVRQLDPVYVDLSQPGAQMQQLQQRLAAARMNEGTPNNYPVTLILANTNDTYDHEGNLDATDLAVDEQTGAIRLRSVFPNPDTVLLPGMFVRANVQQAGESTSIIVPQKAVTITPGGEKTVWVVGDQDKAQKRTIQTGTSYENNWIVLDGLEAGDKLIVEGAMKLSEGAPVKASRMDEKPMTTSDLSAPPSVTDERQGPPDNTLQESSQNNQSTQPEASSETTSGENGN